MTVKRAKYTVFIVFLEQKLLLVNPKFLVKARQILSVVLISNMTLLILLFTIKFEFILNVYLPGRFISSLALYTNGRYFSHVWTIPYVSVFSHQGVCLE